MSESWSSMSLRSVSILLLPTLLLLTPAAVAQREIAVPIADHHLHLASPQTIEVMTPTPVQAIEAPLPEAISELLRRRESAATAGLESLADLYTEDAIMRSRRGGGWVRGRVNIARALAEYSPGYRLQPVAFENRGETGFIAGYFARKDQYNATFQLSLARLDEEWRIVVDNIIPVAPTMNPQPVSAADLVAELDTAGIERGVVHSVAYFFASPHYIGGGDEQAAMRRENDWTSEQVSAYPERLVGFCGVNPLKSYAIGEMERCAKLPGMLGVKLHFGNSGVSLIDPSHLEKLKALFAAANRLHLPIAAHIEEADFQQFGRAQAEMLLTEVLPAAPDVPIQIMHMGGSGPGYHQDDAFGVLAEARESGAPGTAKLYVDVASNVVSNTGEAALELIARRLKQFGLDHVLFASDRMPGVANEDPSTAWESFRRLPLSDDELRTIAQNVAPYLSR